MDEKLKAASTAIKEDAKNCSESVRDEVNAYLISNPSTIQELQEDKEFHKIAVQKYNKSGYTGLFDYDTHQIYFHPVKELVDI